MGIRGDRNDIRFNDEGYYDPTAFEVMKSIDEYENECRRFYKLLKSIFRLCSIAGFEIEGRIVLIDKKTGRIWR